MKGNKKGFTLIELLAVIVILAIIALIAVPVILNILNKANKSAFKDTAYGIVNAGELYFTERRLGQDRIKEDVEITLPNDEIDIKGEVPVGTKLYINPKGQVALATSNGRYCATKGYEDTDIKVVEDAEYCYVPGTLLSVARRDEELGVNEVLSCASDGTECKPGDAFAIKVNEDEIYKFYVVSDDGEKVTLIMDSDLGKEKWYSVTNETNKGPITALESLNTLTSTWDNIDSIESYEYKSNPNAKGTTSTFGYQKLNITKGVGVLTSYDGTTTKLTGTMRARLLTYEEASHDGYEEKWCTTTGGSCPSWLYENLSSSNKGYWLLTFNNNDSTKARYLYYQGSTQHSSTVNTVSNGLRPVIILPKSLISQ